MLRAAFVIFCMLSSAPVAAQSLAGQWDCNGRDGPGSAIRTLQEYRATGQLYHLANMAIGDRTRRMDASLVLRGSWRLEGGVITETFRTGRLRSLQENGRDIRQTPIGRRLSRDIPKRIFGPDQSTRTRITFVSADKFLVSGRMKGACVRR
jgi:hypothetical protein